MIAEYGPWVVSAVGILGFHLAGKKIWWCWYVNVANQVLWVIFALVTDQLGFLVSTLFYLPLFANNARKWTQDHIRTKKTPVRVIKGPVIGKVTKVWEDEKGVYANIEMRDGTNHVGFDPKPSQEKHGL